MQDSAPKDFAFYLDEVRRGSSSPYFAYRVCERSWEVPRKEAGLVRRAAMCLVETDPWFVARADVHLLYVLSAQDLEQLTPLVGTGPASTAAAMLRAKLWYCGCGGPYHVDRKGGRAHLRRALAFLHEVPKKQRHREWHEMLVGCYRVLDYGEYKRTFPTLLRVTAPTSRAAALHDFLNVVAAKKDWQVYERFRREWDSLVPGHHACECYVNDVYTNDGLRATAARNWQTIPDALAKAGAVRGCPHLNTAGLRLDLARLLVGKKRELDAVRGYLKIAAGFPVGGEDVAALDRILRAAIVRSR